MARAQGRASRYSTSDIGAAVPGRWQTWQLRWRIGATSFANVTGGACAAAARADPRPAAATASAASRPRRTARRRIRHVVSISDLPLLVDRHSDVTVTCTVAVVQQHV